MVVHELIQSLHIRVYSSLHNTPHVGVVELSCVYVPYMYMYMIPGIEVAGAVVHVGGAAVAVVVEVEGVASVTGLLPSPGHTMPPDPAMA